jgi:hypothetical protein
LKVRRGEETSGEALMKEKWRRRHRKGRVGERRGEHGIKVNWGRRVKT